MPDPIFLTFDTLYPQFLANCCMLALFFYALMMSEWKMCSGGRAAALFFVNELGNGPQTSML